MSFRSCFWDKRGCPSAPTERIFNELLGDCEQLGCPPNDAITAKTTHNFQS